MSVRTRPGGTSDSLSCLTPSMEMEPASGSSRRRSSARRVDLPASGPPANDYGRLGLVSSEVEFTWSSLGAACRSVLRLGL